jgi:uncharacterized protein YhbP (UPF0306 family)
MAIARSGRRVSRERLRSIAEDLLEASTLASISTVTPRGRAYINTAYVAWAQDLRLIWLSEARAQHSRNLRSNPSAAVAIYDSGQTWGKPDRGIQVFGEARAASEDAASVYAARFPDYGTGESAAYRFYELVPRRVKLFDERALGVATFVTARVDGGRLTWEPTELYTA